MIDKKIKTIYTDMLLNRCSAKTIECDDFLIVHAYNTLGKTKIMVHKVLLRGKLEDTGLAYEIEPFGGGHFSQNKVLVIGIGTPPHLMPKKLDIWPKENV